MAVALNPNILDREESPSFRAESGQSRSPKENPVAGVSDIQALMEDFTTVKTIRVSRGGSWNTPGPAGVANRGDDKPTNTNSWLGFRYVKSAMPQEDTEVDSSSDTAE